MTANDSTKRPLATILLPAYNEELAIGTTVTTLKTLHPDFEILVVDDGSTDATAQEALMAGAIVRSHPYNIGNGAAIKTGLRHAAGQYIIMMDGDGQHDPADIARLLEHRERYDMVVGARSKESKTSLHRDLANKIYNKLASYVAKFKIEDLTSGFRMVKKEVVGQYIYLLPNTFSYPTTLTLSYLRSGRSIKYIPIKTKKRQGKSKIRLLNDGTRFLLIITKIATLFSPLRVFLPVSFAFLILGLSYYVYVFVETHRFSNMALLLFSTSVIIFMIGLVSEQITHIRHDETR